MIEGSPHEAEGRSFDLLAYTWFIRPSGRVKITLFRADASRSCGKLQRPCASSLRAKGYTCFQFTGSRGRTLALEVGSAIEPVPRGPCSLLNLIVSRC